VACMHVAVDRRYRIVAAFLRQSPTPITNGREREREVQLECSKRLALMVHFVASSWQGHGHVIRSCGKAFDMPSLVDSELVSIPNSPSESQFSTTRVFPLIHALNGDVIVRSVSLLSYIILIVQ
jgi:hypothetical protein